MIRSLKRGEVIFLLFLFFFINSCTRPEDNAIKPLKQNITFPSGTEAPSAGTYHPKIYTIQISGMNFHPQEITVHKGDTVVWKNNDLVAHCVTEQKTNAWTSSKIPAGGSWQMAVDSGSNYFCAIHVVMKGAIMVK